MAGLLRWWLALPDPGLIFLTAVAFAAALGGLGPALAAGALSVLVYDVFFVEPFLSLSITHPQDVLLICVFGIVAALVSHLTARARQEAETSRRRGVQIDAVLEEKAKTEAVMEAIEDGLIVLDPAGVVEHVNEVACAILQVERAEAVGRRFDELATRHPHYLRIREAARAFGSSRERDGDRVELALFLRGRDHFFVLRTTPRRARDGSPGGLILALQDVTYLRDQQAQREHLVATLSHELGTPLTSLRLALELLRRPATAASSQDGRPAEEMRELLEAAHEDVLRLEDVRRRFLDLARSRATAIALERSELDLASVVARALRIFAAEAREKGIAIEDRTTAQDLGRVDGDEVKLCWALSNLVANALRYTPRGGRITVDAEGLPDRVAVSVHDTGPGIAPEQRERIFERFSQGTGSGEMGSAGLGLAIVRDIVQAHGGRILLDSAPGAGSRFTLELPRHPDGTSPWPRS